MELNININRPMMHTISYMLFVLLVLGIFGTCTYHEVEMAQLQADAQSN